MIAPPLYVLNTTCVDKQLGISIMEAAITKIEQVVIGYTGSVVVKMKVQTFLKSSQELFLKAMKPICNS